MSEHLLLDAVEDHDIARMIGLLNAGADPDLPDPDAPSWRPIHAAVDELSEGGPLSLLKELVERGATVDARDDAGNTPLMIAARNEAWDAVLLLLEAGADPSVRNVDNQSPLSLSVLAGNHIVIQRMLETRKFSEGDLDKWIGFSGATMLAVAAKRLDVKTIELLVGAGANIYARDDNNNLPIESLAEPNESEEGAWSRAAHLLSEGRP